MAEFPRGGLPPIEFVETTEAIIEREIIATYESITGRVLSAADPVRLFLLSLVAIIVQLNNAVDDAFKMNLLSYARGAFIDHLGFLMGVERSPASFATTRVKFTLSAQQGSALVIAQGTQLAAGQRIFETIEPLIIPSGDLTGEVAARALVAGPEMNGIEAGGVDVIVNPIPFVQKAENITVTSGGAEIEQDEPYVERIRTASNSFSVAGPISAYEFWSYSASPSIDDVVIDSPTPGKVDVYILLQDGVIPEPNDPILDAVYDVLSADRVRPLTDEVEIHGPTAVGFDLDVEWWSRARDADRFGQIEDAVSDALESYLMWQTQKIGRDIVPDELVCRLLQAGAKRVRINSPSFTVISPIEISKADSVNLSYGGAEDD